MDYGPAGSVKPKIDKKKVRPTIDKGGTPVAKPDKALEQMDGGGKQKSQHPKKDQPRIMRYLKR